jgi:hypothetical protein
MSDKPLGSAPLNDADHLADTQVGMKTVAIERPTPADQPQPAPMVRPLLGREVSLAEDEGLPEKYLSIILEELTSTDVATREKALSKLNGLSEFLKTVDLTQANKENFIRNNLIVPLIDHLNLNPEFAEFFREALSRILINLISFDRGRNTLNSIECINLISSSIQPEDLQLEINNELPNVIVESALQSNYLHSIQHILERLDPPNQSITERVYSIIFTEWSNSENPILNAPRGANLIVDLLNLSFTQIQDVNIIALYLNSLARSSSLQLISARFQEVLARNVNSEVTQRIRAIIFSEQISQESRKSIVESLIRIGGMSVLLNILGKQENLEDNQAVKQLVETMINTIQGVLDSASPEQLSEFVVFLTQIGLRINFLDEKWVDIEVRIVTIISELSQKDDESLKEILNPTLIESLTTRLSNSIAVAIEKNDKDSVEIIEKLIVLVVNTSIFSSAQRISVFGVVLENFDGENANRYINILAEMLSESENTDLSSILSGNAEFTVNKDQKLALLAELKKAINFTDERKQEIIKVFVETQKVSRLLILLVLQDDKALEYYRELEYQKAEQSLGTQKIEETLQSIKVQILETLNQQLRTSRVEEQFKKVSSRLSVRLLMLFESSPTAKKRRKIEIATNEVNRSDKGNLETGINSLVTILTSEPDKLAKAIKTDPECYAIIVEVIPELYQQRDRLNIGSKARAALDRLFRLLFNNLEVVRVLPEQVQAIQVEMWKDRLDQFEAASSMYGAEKSEILTKKGRQVNLDSIHKREKKRYESRLSKKFVQLSSPRGECLSEIVNLHNQDRARFEIYANQPNFSDVIEYAIDQYSRFPDKFLQISDAEKEFILFLVENLWQSLSSRVKYKLSQQILTLWSKKDDAGYDILTNLIEERDDSADYSFVNLEVLNFIGASFQQLPQNLRNELIGFAELNTKKTKVQRTLEGLRSFVQRDSTSAYANDLNYLMSYLATRNRINAPEYYVAVEQVVAEKASVDQQVEQEQSIVTLNNELEGNAEMLSPEGSSLTDNNPELKIRVVEPMLARAVEFVDKFKFESAPLTFRQQDELLEVLPRLIDLLVYAVQTGGDVQRVTKIQDFLFKFFEKVNPSYLSPTRIYVEVLEDFNSGLAAYSTLTKESRFTDFNTQMEKVVGECEKRAMESINSSLTKLFESISPRITLNSNVIVSIKLKRPVVVENEIRKNLDILLNNRLLIKKLLEKQDEKILNSLVAVLSRILLYINLNPTNVVLVKSIQALVINMGSQLPEEYRKQIMPQYRENVQKFEKLKGTTKRAIPLSVVNNLNQLAA